MVHSSLFKNNKGCMWRCQPHDGAVVSVNCSGQQKTLTGKPLNDLDPTETSLISSAVMSVSAKINNKTIVRSFRNE